MCIVCLYSIEYECVWCHMSVYECVWSCMVMYGMGHCMGHCKTLVKPLYITI